MLTPEKLLLTLDSEHVAYTLYHHPPVGSGDDDALFPPMQGHIVKNLVLTDKKHRHLVLFTLPLEAKADLRALSTALNLPRFSFARTSDLAYLGVPPGMVSPLGLLNDVGQEILYAEPEELSSYPLINCHPLHNSMSIDIGLQDVHRLIEKSGHVIHRVAGVISHA